MVSEKQVNGEKMTKENENDWIDNPKSCEKIWILIDFSSGSDGFKNYLRWFPTKELALKFLSEEQGHTAKLSDLIPFVRYYSPVQIHNRALEFEDNRKRKHTEEALDLIYSIENKPHRAIQYISELIEAIRMEMLAEFSKNPFESLAEIINPSFKGTKDKKDDTETS